MKIIYVDFFFFINYFMNYIFLTVTALISSRPVSKIRINLASIIGSIYAFFSLINDYSSLNNILCILLAGFVMCILAFGFQNIKNSTLNFLIMLISAFICAGCILAVNFIISSNHGVNDSYYTHITTSLIVTTGLLIKLFSSFILKGRCDGKEIVNVTIKTNERYISLRALKDTGNFLKDPINNRPVMIIGKKHILPLLKHEVKTIIANENLNNAFEVLEKINAVDNGHKFRLLPYHTIDKNTGYLLVFTAEIIIESQKSTTVIALNEHPISNEMQFDAIMSA